MQDGNRIDAESLAEQRPFVEALARRLVFDPHMADDIVQETLLAAMKTPPRRSVRGWLAKVVRNIAYRTLRSDERRRRREHRVARPDVEPAAADLVVRATWHRKVVETVLAMDEPYRSTLLLRFYEDLQPSEIAERLGVPSATVRTRLKRGLERMRRRLDAEHDGDRRTWRLALLPLAFANAPASAATAASVVEVAVMSAKMKLLLAMSLLLALLGTTWVVRGDWRETFEVERRGDRGMTLAPVARETTEVELATAIAERTVTVRVEDDQGRPLADAQVEILDLISWPAGPYYPQSLALHRALQMSRGQRILTQGRTRADGSVDLRVEDERGFSLRGSHPQHATVTKWVWNRGLKSVLLRLGRGYSLSGRVLDEEEHPIPGALVLVGDGGPYASLGSNAPPLRAVADEDGRYALEALPGRERTVWAAWPGGFPVLVARLRFPAMKQFDIHLQRGGVLEGTVRTVDGKSLAGVTVFVEARLNRFTSYALTDSRGEYRIDTMPPGFIAKVKLYKDGYAQIYETIDPSVPVRHGDRSRLDGKMVRGAVISGVVRGPDGPLAGADIASFHQAGSHGLVVRNTQTDAQGRYALEGLPEGKHLIGATKAGFQALVERNPFAALEQEDHPLFVVVGQSEKIERDLELKQGDCTVEGVVVGPDDRPFPNARVRGSFAYGETDGDGRFRLRVPKNAHLTVHAEGYELEGGSYAVSDGLEVTGIRLKLRVETRILLTGTVMPTTDEAWVEITALPEKQSAFASAAEQQWAGALSAPVDRAGRYKLEVPSGKLFAVRAAGVGVRNTEPKGLVIEQGQRRYVLDFALDGGHTLEGRSLPGAHISVIPPMDAMERRREATQSSPAPPLDAVADEQGAFRVANLPAGEWEVRADALGCAGAHAKVRLPQSETLILEPQPYAALSGVVVFEDRAPAVGARIYAWELTEEGEQRAGQGANYGTRTDEKGRWRLEGLRPGRLDVKVRGSETCNLVRMHDDTIRGGQTDVRLVVRRGLTISGIVVDVDGEGVPNVYLHAQQEQGQVRYLYGSDTTDAEGRFELSGLPDGDHLVTLKGGQKRWLFGEIVAGAQDLRIVFDSRRDDLGREDTKTIDGRLLDPQGRPLAGRTLYAFDGKGTRAWRQKRDVTDAEGRFSFSLLKPGQYNLRMDATGEGLQPVRDLGIFDAGSRNVEIRTQRGLLITGRVTNEKGTPLAGVWVLGGKGDDDKVFVATDARGRFELGGFRKGALCTLRSHVKGLVTALARDVEAGSEGIELVLKPGLDARGVVVNGKKANVRFFWLEDEERSASTITDQQGRFHAVGLLPGRYRVTVDGKPAGTIEAGATELKIRIDQ